MNYKISLMSSLFIIFTSIANAGTLGTLIISDIDDTIKVSHVLSSVDKLSRATDISTPFAGMSQLYQLILNEKFESSKIIYLSNAPKEVLGIPALELSHRNFLKYNKFPNGELDLRLDIFDQNHKINEIRRLIAKYNPQLVIFFGDNGERDADIYHQAYREYSDRLQIITFIHQVYSVSVSDFLPRFFEEKGRKLYSEQTGFVTPIEISLELKNLNILSEASYRWLVKNIGPYIVSEGSIKIDRLRPISFPDFKKCHDFIWKWNVSSELTAIYDKIKSVCNK